MQIAHLASLCAGTRSCQLSRPIALWPGVLRKRAAVEGSCGQQRYFQLLLGNDSASHECCVRGLGK